MYHITDINGITVAVIDMDSLDGIEVAIPEGGKLNEGVGVLYGRGSEPRPPCPGDDFVFNEREFKWVIPLDNIDGHMRDVHLKRQVLLSKSDWTQLPDVPLATKEAWAIYRQELRDITDQPGYPLDVVWPVAPS